MSRAGWIIVGVLILLIIVIGAGVYWYVHPFSHAVVVADPNAGPVTEDSTQTGTVSGYFYTYKGTDENDGPTSVGTQTCTALVVTGADATGTRLKDYFLQKVEQGNTVNQKSPDGNLVLTIDTRYLSAAAIDALYHSSGSAPVTLTVQKTVQDGNEAGPCASFVNVLSLATST